MSKRYGESITIVLKTYLEIVCRLYVDFVIRYTGLQWVTMLLTPLFSHVIICIVTYTVLQMDILPPNQYIVWRMAWSPHMSLHTKRYTRRSLNGFAV